MECTGETFTYNSTYWFEIDFSVVYMYHNKFQALEGWHQHQYLDDENKMNIHQDMVLKI